MEEYIKRKDVLDIFGKYMFAGYRGNGKSSFSEIIAPTIYRAIEDVPSADVREAVRCKDCKYRGKGLPYCAYFGKTEFCSKGERKETDSEE